MRLVAIAVGLAAALVMAAPEARAQSASATCDIYEIEASNNGKSIDSGLGKLSKTLKKPPFNSWKTYKLLKKHAKAIAVKGSVNLKLAAGGSLDLELKAITQKGSKSRLKIGVVLTNKKGKATKATTEINSGEAFLIGGEQLEGKKDSAYFVGIACTATP